MARKLILAAVFAAACWAQPSQVVIIPGSPPGGAGAACTDTAHGYLATTGIIYTCQSSVWTSAGGGGGTTCVKTSYTIPYTDSMFIVASTTATKTLVTRGSQAVRLCRAVFQIPTVAYAGTSITAVTCALGTATSGNSAIYAPALSTMQITQSWGIGGSFSGTDLATPDSDLTVRLTCTATGANFGNGATTVLTAGSFKTTVGLETLP